MNWETETKMKRFNKGTKYGRDMIKQSLAKLGAGRSVVVDRNGESICGQEVLEVASELGLNIVTIETYGDVLVCVKRMDLEKSDVKAMELSFVDNFSQEKNADWDTNALLDAMQEKMSFDPRKWGGHSCLVKELDLRDLLKDDVKPVEKREKKEEVFDQTMQLSLFE